MPIRDSSALDELFRTARTRSGWLPQPVTDDEPRAPCALMKWAPTSTHGSPVRSDVVRTPEAKARLKPALSPGNPDKAMAAPATALIGYDVEFHEELPPLLPHTDARSCTQESRC